LIRQIFGVQQILIFFSAIKRVYPAGSLTQNKLAIYLLFPVFYFILSKGHDFQENFFSKIWEEEGGG